jgi:multiple sugar transport system permease protein
LRLGLLFSLIGTLQLFNEPEILKNVSGAITPTFTPNIFAYNQAIIQTNFYYGGAIAAIMGAITFIFSFIFMRFTQR